MAFVGVHVMAGIASEVALQPKRKHADMGKNKKLLSVKTRTPNPLI
jgi:hypothetical protein